MNTNPSNSNQHPSVSDTISIVKEIVTMGKDLFALLRDASLLVVAILLICFPTTFNVILVNAGFEEGSFMGLKWKKQLAQSNITTRDALENISKLIQLPKSLIFRMPKFILAKAHTEVFL